MKRSHALLLMILVALALLIGTGVWGFYRFMEPREEPVFLGYKGEARYNRLLQADHLLRKLRIGVESRARLGEVGPEMRPADVLVMPFRHYPLNEADLKALLAWVERGGHLVVTGMGTRKAKTIKPGSSSQSPKKKPAAAPRSGDAAAEGTADATADVKAAPDDEPTAEPEDAEDMAVADPLLDHFGVRDFVRRGTALPDWLRDDGREPAARQVPLLPNTPPMALALDNGRYLTLDQTVTPDLTVTELGQLRLVSLIHGSGRVTVMSDMDMWLNGSLDKHQHAEYLWWVLHLQPKVRTVHLIYQDEMPSLWVLLWRQQFPVMATLVVGLIFVLWAGWWRFGPLLPLAPPHRRSLLEHVQATGRFYWVHGRRESLLAAVRDALFRRMQRIHPHLATLPMPELATTLAPLVDLDRQAILHALTAQAEGQRDFAEQIRILELIRKRL